MKKPTKDKPRVKQPASEDKLALVRGGALNAYMRLKGETQGDIKG